MALKNSQYDAIMRTYYAKQTANKRILDKHIDEVYSKIPQVEELDMSVSSIALMQARKLLDGDTKAINELKCELDNIAKKKQQLLTRNGFPKDYLELHYDCKDCKDTGYIDSKKCHCFKQATIDLLYTQSNLKEILKCENFDTFSYKWYAKEYIDPKSGVNAYDNICKVVNTCKAFINNFDTQFENIIFFGDTGVGKTFLTHCIANELIKNAKSVVYLTAIELFDIFAKYEFNHNSEEKGEDYYEHILSCDLLIIDDLGTEVHNTFTNSKLFYCINQRIIDNKSTIISTNLSFNDLVDAYSERIFSRLTSSYSMLKVFGDDIRLKKKFV